MPALTSNPVTPVDLPHDPGKEIYNYPDLWRYAVPSKLNVPHLGSTSITYCEIPDETSAVRFIHAIDTQIGAVMFHRPSFSHNKGECLAIIFRGRSAAKKALTKPGQWQGIPYSATIAGLINYDIQHFVITDIYVPEEGEGEDDNDDDAMFGVMHQAI
ncbi:hypothetical protein BGZ99_001673 [Dissophora globulifera]|uniref:Uncharacterized protein n=1 Tax=Dissophora globulifera TaxID=979702 RepID=A0A9P6R0G2_9FUNG|nr:hypothetical protein BGZ99_001673 [Dissophora globulifera]